MGAGPHLQGRHQARRCVPPAPARPLVRRGGWWRPRPHHLPSRRSATSQGRARRHRRSARQCPRCRPRPDRGDANVLLLQQPACQAGTAAAKSCSSPLREQIPQLSVEPGAAGDAGAVSSAVMAVGMTAVIILGGIDLSVAGSTGLAAVIALGAAGIGEADTGLPEDAMAWRRRGVAVDLSAGGGPDVLPDRAACGRSAAA